MTVCHHQVCQTTAIAARGIPNSWRQWLTNLITKTILWSCTT